jgi:Leucine-rich repeat (LRR) protein
MNWMMKTVIVFSLLGFILSTNRSFGQIKGKEISAVEVEEYKEKIKQLISFLEFALNAIGDPNSTTREKETIINQSYLKAFRDSKVIIEDDLVENRTMVTNKNVQAYLKDIDFFFKEVRIEFDIQDIEYLVNDQGRDYFKVTMNRLLNGITLNYDTVVTVRQRFIEVNVDEAQQDLKIASIYTTRLSEKDELISWWYSLPLEWKAVFKKEIGAYDSLDFSSIQQVTKLEKIDVSNNKRITNLEAIGKLNDLRDLNVSNTPIDNLLPLRNLTRLRKLDISNTQVNDLEPLKYSVSLAELYCDNVQITSVEFLENLQSLEVLHCATNSISDIEPIKNLQNLRSLDFSETLINTLDVMESLPNIRYLNVARTFIDSLDPLKNLRRLEKLDFSGSQVRSVDPLKDLPNLKMLICNNTPLNSIEILNDNPSLERIYCDNTLVTRNQANLFMSMNPHVLVIFKSDLLKSWWAGLSDTWKNVFIKQVGVAEDPDKEELARIAKVNSIDISGNQEIENLEPLSILENLKSISFANTGIENLSPLQELDKLEYIDCSFNPINNLSTLSFLRHLKVLNIENTEVDDLSPLSFHDEMQFLYCDDTPIEHQKIMDFAAKYPSLLMIYKTDSLISWWNDLDEEWIRIFNRHLKSLAMTASISDYQVKGHDHGENIPSREDLHRIANLQIVSIQNNSRITHLQPISQLINLRNLQVVNTLVSDLTPISKLNKLKSLDISYNPITDISPLRGLSHIVHLNLANTPVASLDAVIEMKDLEEIDCSGTQIRNLNPLARMHQLKLLNFSNTNVRTIAPIEYHTNLERVSCFNTRLSPRRVERFRKSRPNVDVRFY